MGHDGGDAAEFALDHLVSRVVQTRAEIARMQADEAALLAEAGELVLRREKHRRDAGKRAPHDLPLREVTSELGAAMRLSDRAVQERISTASTLLESFPATFVSLREGRIDLAHATAIIDAGAGLADPTLRAEYERIVLGCARVRDSVQIASDSPGRRREDRPRDGRGTPIARPRHPQRTGHRHRRRHGPASGRSAGRARARDPRSVDSDGSRGSRSREREPRVAEVEVVRPQTVESVETGSADGRVVVVTGPGDSRRSKPARSRDATNARWTNCAPTSSLTSC